MGRGFRVARGERGFERTEVWRGRTFRLEANTSLGGQTIQAEALGDVDMVMDRG